MEENFQWPHAQFPHGLETWYFLNSVSEKETWQPTPFTDHGDPSELFCGCAVFLGSRHCPGDNGYRQGERTSSSLWGLDEKCLSVRTRAEKIDFGEKGKKKSISPFPFLLLAVLALSLEESFKQMEHSVKRKRTWKARCAGLSVLGNLFPDRDKWVFKHLPRIPALLLITPPSVSQPRAPLTLPPPLTTPSPGGFPPATLRRSGKLELPSGARDVRLRT